MEKKRLFTITRKKLNKHVQAVDPVCSYLQVPILEPVTDAIDNFVCSVAIAGNFSIPEVTVYFNHELFRGNRVTKISTEDFFGFQTNNYPALAKVGTSFMGKSYNKGFGSWLNRTKSNSYHRN